MAIEINNNVVIDNDRRAELGIVNFGAYTIEQLRNKDVVGKEVGDFVYNIGNKELSYWTGSAWTGVEASVSGGAQWRVGNYNYHMFRSPGIIRTNFTVEVEALIIAGGGGGGSGRFHGGGGAGGFRISTVTLSNGDNTVVVGEGGKGGDFWPGSSVNVAPPSARGSAGGDSSIGGLVANGGGKHSGAGGSGGGDVTGGDVNGGGAAIRTPDNKVQGHRGGNITNTQSWYPSLGLVSSGGGGAKSAGVDRPVYDSNQTFQCAGYGYAVSEFAALSSKYPGVAWSVPSNLSQGFERGVCGGGAGYYMTNRNATGFLTPAAPVGGGGNSRYAYPVEYLSATGYGGGGGVSGYYSTNNYQGGNGKDGVVIVRYNVNSMT